MKYVLNNSFTIHIKYQFNDKTVYLMFFSLSISKKCSFVHENINNKYISNSDNYSY